MEFKKFAKRFFTLDRHHAEGFTLVELIVVIAILAILASVAVPAYNAYIEKADRAGDETLLAAVNKAFNGAVVAGGGDILFVSDAKIKLTGGKVNTDNGIIATFTDGSAADYREEFALLYENNDDATFKYFTQLDYDENLHVFKGLDEGAIIEALKTVIGASSYNGKLEELTGDVSSLTTSLGGYLNTDAGKQMMKGSGYEAYLTNNLDIDVDKEENKQKLANGAALYLAHSAANMSDENIDQAKEDLALALLAHADGTETLSTTVIESLAGNTGSTLAGYAMLYATAEAIALQAGPESDEYKALKGENVKIEDPTSVLTATSEVFSAAQKSGTLEAYVMGTGDKGSFNDDMDAYFQTLQALNLKESELKPELEKDNLFTSDNETVKDLLDKLSG